MAPADELEQAINILLIRCAEHYDVNKGVVAFSSYVYRSVAMSIDRTLSDDQYNNFRTRRRSMFKHACEELKAEGNLNPTHEEILARMPNNSDAVIRIYGMRHPLSLETRVVDDESLTLKDVVASDESLSDDYDKIEQNHRLHLALDILSEQSANIIKKLYFEEKRQAEVAKECGISQSVLSRLAIRKLKVLKVLMENYMGELMLADNLREQYAEAKQAHKLFNTNKAINSIHMTNANVIKLITLYNYKQESKYNRDHIIRTYANTGENTLCDPVDAAKVVDICVLNRPTTEICTKYKIQPTNIDKEINGILQRAQEPTREK